MVPSLLPIRIGFTQTSDLNEALKHALSHPAEDEGLSMELELHFACQDLKNMDATSLTDSAIAVYLKSG